MEPKLISHPARFRDFEHKEKWCILLLLLLSFTGISVINIGKAMLTPFHLLMGFQIGYGLLVSTKLDKKISITLLTFMLYVLVINVIQHENIRFTSVLYTVIFGLEATILFNLLSRCRKEAILYAFKLIILCYFLNLFLGFCFDLINFRHDFVLKFIRVYYSKTEAGGRPMGFSSEPSYAAFILSVVFLSHSYLTGHQRDKNTAWLFGLVFLSILLSRSAYGFIFLAVISMDWLVVIFRNGDRLLRLLFPFISIALIIACVYALSNTEHETIQRLARFSSTLVDTQYKGKEKMLRLQEADGSAFARIAPTYLLFNSGEDQQFKFIFGQGAGSAGVFLSSFLTGILVDEGRDAVDTGIMPALLFDYGYVGGILFLLFLYFSFEKLSCSFWLLFLLIIPNANINTQLIWFAVICFSYVSIFLKNNSRQYSS